MNELQTLEQDGINRELSGQILKILQKGDLNPVSSGSGDDWQIPDVDGGQIVDLSQDPIHYQVRGIQLERALDEHPQLRRSAVAKRIRTDKTDPVLLSEPEIEETGRLLLSEFGFGILNGGSASSYFDEGKNRQFSPALYQIFEREFRQLKERYQDCPKALCPAFLTNPETAGLTGPIGPTFFDLKIRALLQKAAEQWELYRNLGLPPEQIQTHCFQMTSALTAKPLEEYLQHGWKTDSAELEPLSRRLGWSPDQIQSAEQPLISTFEKNPETGEWQYFWDEEGRHLPMPGGHGQCFFALKKIFHSLWNQGVRYISIGNIDNIAYIPRGKFLGLLALSGQDAFFATSYRTAVDQKGGILMRRNTPDGSPGRLSCLDIGVGIDAGIIGQSERAGKPLLFNCAIGYFRLDTLLRRLESITEQLPLRISEHRKNQKHYWQVEQVSWEIIGLLEKIIIGAVQKEQHLLAAKLQLESFVNSGYQVGLYPPELAELKGLALRFSASLRRTLRQDCHITI